MPRNRTIVFALLLLLFALNSTAEDIRFDRISIEQGLSASLVTCIIQDSVGYIWIGTGDGLNKYDGYTFTKYRYESDNQNSLSNNFISAIVEDSSGRLWVGTEEGLNLYDRANDRFIRYDADESDRTKPSISHIECLTVDTRGNLWIGSEKSGVNVLIAETGEFMRIRVDGGDVPGLAHDGITAINVDDDGSVWIMCWSSAISIFDWETQTFRYLIISAENLGRVSGFVKRNADLYWIGTGKGLVEYNSRTGEQRIYFSETDDSSSLPTNRIRHLFKDSLGRVWIGTNNGVAIWEEGKSGFQIVQYDPADPKSLSINLVGWITEDRSGAIWIATRGKGINLYAPTKYKFHNLNQIPNNPNSLNGNYVYSILEGNDGHLWIGTFEGFLNRVDLANNHFDSFDLRREDLRDTNIPSLLQWSEQEILVGLASGSIRIYNTALGEFQSTIDTTDFTSDMLRSSTGELYVALRARGLRIYEQESDGSFTFKSEIGSDQIENPRLFCIVETESFIWFGGENGLHRYDPINDHIKSYLAEEAPGSLTNGSILYLATTSDGTLWIGTRRGLNRYVSSDDNFIGYTVSHGLPNDVIYSILEGDDGDLWLGTNSGLIHWDPRSEKVLNHYLEEDGLQSNEFNTGACYKSPSGTMYFGGVNGVSSFEPHQIPKNDVPPPVVLTSFSIFGKRHLFDEPLSELKQIELKHDESYIGLEFAALDYTSPAHNQYRYQMTGVDQNWVEAGNRNYVNYNLNPGKYIFHVRGSNSDGVWNNAGALIEIIVLPPYWLTWWFRAGTILVGLAILWSIFVLRTQMVRKQRDTLRQEVTRRTAELRDAVSELESFSYTVSHDLRAPLRNLQGFCELLGLENDPHLGEKSAHYITRIRENASRMEELITDILWLSRAANSEIVYSDIDLSTMAEDVIDELRRGQPERTIEMDIQPGIRVPGDKRLIRLVMDNLIGNAWKFTSTSDPAHIALSAETKGTGRIIALKDNGIGFESVHENKIFEPFKKLHTPDQYEGSGIGLATVRKVVMRHGGRIWAESVPGEGSTFFFILPNIK